MLKRFCGLAAIVMAMAVSQPATAAQNSNCLPTVGVLSGLQMVNLMNASNSSLVSSFSGTSAPVTDCLGVTIPGQLFYDTSDATNKYFKVWDGASPITAFAIDATLHELVPQVAGGTQPTLTAASTTDLGATPHATVFVGGATTINSFGSSAPIGTLKFLTFTGAPTITYNATSMILPGGTSLTASAGDTWTVEHLGSGNWRARQVQLASGAPLLPVPTGTSLDWNGFTAPAGFLIEDGSAVSRSTYSALFAVIAFQTSAATVLNNATITGMSSTANLGRGMAVCGPGIANGTTIVTVASGTSITITPTATLTATNTITVAPNGCGDGSTTFNLPNMVGRTSAGRDPLGTNLTFAGSGIYNESIGATGGTQNFLLAQNQLINTTLGVTATFTGTPQTWGSSGNVGINPGQYTGGSGSFAPNTIFAANVGPLQTTVTPSGSITSGVTASLNGGVTPQPLRVVQPTATKVKIIKY